MGGMNEITDSATAELIAAWATKSDAHAASSTEMAEILTQLAAITGELIRRADQGDAQAEAWTNEGAA